MQESDPHAPHQHVPQGGAGPSQDCLAEMVHGRLRFWGSEDLEVRPWGQITLSLLNGSFDLITGL